MEQFRIFVQDLGESGYSGLDDVSAETLLDAWNEAKRLYSHMPCKLIVLPHSRRDLWPDSKTGVLSPAAERLGKR